MKMGREFVERLAGQGTGVDPALDPQPITLVEMRTIARDLLHYEGQARKWEATANSYAAQMREQKERHLNKIAQVHAEYGEWRRMYEALVALITRMEAMRSPTVMQFEHGPECRYLEGRPERPCTCGLLQLFQSLADRPGKIERLDDPAPIVEASPTPAQEKTDGST